MIPTIVIILFSRDKHGRPMSHPDYDPRTLLVKDLFSNNYYLIKKCVPWNRTSTKKDLVLINHSYLFHNDDEKVKLEKT